MIVDMAGQQWGRLLVLSIAGSGDGGIRWLCRCECGTERVFRGYLLRRGVTRSCGCITREINAARSPRLIELKAGDRFGRWVLVSRAPTRRERGSNHSRWLCRCDCGKTRSLTATSLKHRRTLSCGCVQAEALAARATRHGMTKTPIYRIWSGMIKRCRNETDKDYPRYGARGITVCDRWLKFENFFADIPPRLSARHTLDRRDNNGNYEPTNVRWATPIEQQNNLRSNRRITFNGRTMNAAQWAREIGVNMNAFLARLNRGWTVEEAIVYRPCRPHVIIAPRRKLNPKARRAFFNLHKGICCLCHGRVTYDEPWQEEHIVPRSRGGSHAPSNRGVAHWACAIEKTKADKAALAKDKRDHAVALYRQRNAA